MRNPAFLEFPQPALLQSCDDAVSLERSAQTLSNTLHANATCTPVCACVCARVCSGDRPWWPLCRERLRRPRGCFPPRSLTSPITGVLGITSLKVLWGALRGGKQPPASAAEPREVRGVAEGAHPPKQSDRRLAQFRPGRRRRLSRSAHSRGRSRSGLEAGGWRSHFRLGDATGFGSRGQDLEGHLAGFVPDSGQVPEPQICGREAERSPSSH